jgi:hypothetical protein
MAVAKLGKNDCNVGRLQNLPLIIREECLLANSQDLATSFIRLFTQYELG